MSSIIFLDFVVFMIEGCLIDVKFVKNNVLCFLGEA